MQQTNMRSVRQPGQMNRMINGMLRFVAFLCSLTRLYSPALGNNPGPMPNGAQGHMYPMPPSGHQPNGMPIPSGAPTPAGANPSQPQNFPQLVSGQRPGGPQHRVPNGVNPYQSPTMAHSPQNPATNPIPNAQHSQPPMGQLGPSPMPQISAQSRMLPPGSNMGGVSSAQAPPFGRPPSRPNTPGNMIQRSPSMAARQQPTNIHEAQYNNELNRLGPAIVNAVKQELNLGDKDSHSLTFEDKVALFLKS